MSTFPDRRYFARVAGDTGFRAEPLETVFRLASLLGDIDAAHGEEFSLRGGTALNLIHLDVPRLSVDIDLDFVGAVDADEVLVRRPAALDGLSRLAADAGYSVSRERESYAMAHLRLGYQNASGRPAFLKLDVNFLDRVPVLPTQRLQLRHPFTGDLPNVTVQTLALPELAAAKAIALARRSLARDLFDVAMLSGLKGLDVELMRTVLVVRGASYPPPSPADYTPTVVDRIRTTSWRSEVLALCRRPIPLDLDQARSVAGSLLEQLVDLAPGHVEFLAALDRGELRPGVLPGEGWPERVSLNPGLSWRLRTGLEGLEER